MIERFDSPDGARAWCRQMRARGKRLGFVPTMGALHAGHLALVDRACRENDAVVVSIFVNPLQFDDPSDLEHYPRDFEGDSAALNTAGAGAVFTGTLAQFFPHELDADGKLKREHAIEPGPGALGLEGEFRGGHFGGVATIVDRLFDVVEPDIAYFGQKDFQQTLIVRDLAGRRGQPRIVVGQTVRDADGLALSSRNVHLSAGERADALVIPRALARAQALWSAGERSPARLEQAIQSELAKSPIEVEYATLRDPDSWTPDLPQGPLARGVALVAARVGDVRLIDNCVLAE